ncbi:MAG: SGNH/GDSL hydrolase family protein [Candidatus Auribacterota bacterium]|nr:SGNH/GDSL hydrolase family protein [Candidatus Auribacterota bacterium]
MIKNIILLIISILFVVLLAEGAVRIFGLAPGVEKISAKGLVFSTNPDLRYTLKPDSILESLNTRININKDGYRGKAYNFNKSDGEVIRILCLGDSIGLGLYLKDEETFCSQLETRLNNEKLFGKRWEVINFGVPGYNTINEIELLKVKGLKYGPDLVVLQYCFNDHGNKSDLDTRLKDALVEHHRLIGLLMNPALKIISRSKLFLLCAVRFKSLKIDLESKRRWWIPGNYVYDGDFFVKGLEEFKLLSEEYDFQTLVVLFPYFEKKDRFSEYSWSYERVIGQCIEFGTPFINLLDYFKKYYPEDKPYPKFHLDKVHPTGYGNSVATDAIFHYLSTNPDKFQ